MCREARIISQVSENVGSALQPKKTSASSATSAVLIMKVFAACDDFDSKKQPLPTLFPASSAPPASSAVRGFGCASTALRFKVQGCSQADQKVWPTLQPQKTSASSATSAFQGFDPGFGCGFVAPCLRGSRVQRFCPLLAAL